MGYVEEFHEGCNNHYYRSRLARLKRTTFYFGEVYTQDFFIQKGTCKVLTRFRKSTGNNCASEQRNMKLYQWD